MRIPSWAIPLYFFHLVSSSTNVLQYFNGNFLFFISGLVSSPYHSFFKKKILVILISLFIQMALGILTHFPQIIQNFGCNGSYRGSGCDWSFLHIDSAQLLFLRNSLWLLRADFLTLHAPATTHYCQNHRKQVILFLFAHFLRMS